VKFLRQLLRLSPKKVLVGVAALAVTCATGVVTLFVLLRRALHVILRGPARGEADLEELRQRVAAYRAVERERAQPRAAEEETSGSLWSGEGQPPPSPRVRTRREFLALVSGALAGGAAIVIAVPVIGALVAPLTRPQPPEWRTVGSINDFPIGSTVLVTFEDPSPLSWSGVASQTAAWLRRRGSTDFIAFSVNCTHLGCPVRWVPGGQLFLCPCHGGVFYADGTVAAGPPQLPLYQYPVRIQGNAVQVQSGPVPIV
jgi:menaquinol-cytochrome c reductase iron-sulfur subunit